MTASNDISSNLNGNIVTHALRFLLICVLVPGLIAGCSRMANSPSYQASQPAVANLPQATTPPPSSPVQRLEQQAQGLEVSGFIEASALPQMTAKDRSEASSAQFYALQFGRPGAPRNWSGDTGATGKVTVGPFIRVNNLDCREFTHEVTVAGQSYAKAGTSCREVNGEWQVVTTG